MTSNNYIKPIRRILTNKDLEIFSESQTKEDLLNFIITLNDSVKGKTTDEPVTVSPVSDFSFFF